MTYALQFTEEFDLDLSKIIWWYAIQHEGLEQEFLLSFEAVSQIMLILQVARWSKGKSEGRF